MSAVEWFEVPPALLTWPVVATLALAAIVWRTRRIDFSKLDLSRFDKLSGKFKNVEVVAEIQQIDKFPTQPID